MGRRRDRDDQESRRPPAYSPEQRENQLVSMAYDLAEEQIRSGTASSQTISHFLKLGSTRERLEQQRIEHENELTAAKIENMASAARIEELYTSAMNAMRGYSGQDPLPQPEFDDET